MRFNLSILLFWGVVLLILSTQGILMFNVFKLFGAWELKSVIQPLGVLLVAVYFIINKLNNPIRISQIDFILFGYFALSFILLLINAESIESVYIGSREVFLIFILIFMFRQLTLSENQWNWIARLVFLLVLANIFFTFLVYVIGLVPYMKLLTGEFFWGNHPIYKFKISNFLHSNLFRVPALVGEAATLGHFGVFAFFLLNKHEKYKKLSYLSLILVAFCFIRSVYLIVILYWIFIGLSTSKRAVKFVLYSLPILPVALVVMVKYGLFDLRSLIMRFDYWQTNILVEYNFIYGGAIGEVGKATTSGGFEDTIDNYWLFLLFSIGIIGIVLAFIFLYEKSRSIKEVFFMTLAVCISGFFITLSQSMVILVMFPMMFMYYKDLKKRSELK